MFSTETCQKGMIKDEKINCTRCSRLSYSVQDKKKILSELESICMRQNKCEKKPMKFVLGYF